MTGATVIAGNIFRCIRTLPAAAAATYSSGKFVRDPDMPHHYCPVWFSFYFLVLVLLYFFVLVLVLPIIY